MNFYTESRFLAQVMMYPLFVILLLAYPSNVAGLNKGNIVIATSKQHKKLALAIGKIVNRALRKSFSLRISPNDTASILHLNLTEADLALTSREMLAKGRSVNRERTIREIAHFNERLIYVLAARGLKLMSIKDLKGSRISIGQKGTRVNRLASEVLEQSNVKANFLHLNQSSSINLLAEGKVDAIFVEAAFTSDIVANITKNQGMRLIPIAKEGLMKKRGASPWMSYIIPKNKYPNVPYDVQTLRLVTVLVGNKNIDDEFDQNLRAAIRLCWLQKKCAISTGADLIR